MEDLLRDSQEAPAITDSWLVTSGLGSSEVVDWKVTAESDVTIATSDAAVAYAVIIAGVGGYD